MGRMAGSLWVNYGKPEHQIELLFFYYDSIEHEYFSSG